MLFFSSHDSYTLLYAEHVGMLLEAFWEGDIPISYMLHEREDIHMRWALDVFLSFQSPLKPNQEDVHESGERCLVWFLLSRV